MNEQITPLLQEQVSLYLNLMPIVFVFTVLLASIAFDVIDFNGNLGKKYYLKYFIICFVLSGLAFLFNPDKVIVITDYNSLVIGIIAGLAAIKIYAAIKKRKK